MSFASPSFLWLLLLIPLAAALYVLAQRRRVRYAARFTNLDLLANVVDASPGRRRHLPAVFALAALAALLLALARPQMTVAVARDEATVVLALDTSGSMMATDVTPSRLAAAQAAASKFLDGLPKRVRVGVVSFATGASVLVAATDDRASVRSALDGLEAQGGTALGEAIVRSTELAPEDGTRGADGEQVFSILLLSDGENSVGIDPARPPSAQRKPAFRSTPSRSARTTASSRYPTTPAFCIGSRSRPTARRSSGSPTRPAASTSRR